MKKILILLFCLVAVYARGQNTQTFYGSNFIFNSGNTWSQDQAEYVARDYIYLQDGFTANSFIGQYFRARIDDKLIVPMDDYTTTPYDEHTASVIDFNLPVGSIEGSAAVGPDGSANYTIPINVPPGIQGVQPNLSITYNSNVPNGLFGMGWNLSGISTITRMSKTVFKDGDLCGVNLDENDLFALDGQRLVLEVAATYGDDGVFYRTENESNIRIQSLGTQGDGPAWFKVYFPDGSIAEYGLVYNDQNASYIPEGTSTVMTWYINKYMDRHGNYMLFYYRDHESQKVIDYILYTGNGTAGVEPMNRIDFYYEERIDENFAYSGGAKMKQNLLLTKIVVKPELRKEIEYLFEYYYDSNLKTSKLNQVKYFSKGEELNSTKIVWNNNIQYFGSEYFTLQGSDPQKPRRTCSGDFDGDGKDELFVLEGEYYSVNTIPGHFHSQRAYIYDYDNSTQTFINSASFDLYNHRLIWFDKPLESIDVDGDGIEEVRIKCFEENNDYYSFFNKIYKIEGGYQSLTYMYDETSLSYSIYSHDANPYVKSYMMKEQAFVDFNGDGIQDEFSAYTHFTVDYQRYGFQFKALIEEENVSFTNSFTNPASNVQLIDFNGNGKTDILVTYGSYSQIFEYSDDPITWNGGSTNYYGNGFHQIYMSSFPASSTDTVYFGDFNGDRKTDVLKYTNNQYFVGYSNGKDQFKLMPNPLNINFNPFAFLKTIADFDGDGRDELIFSYSYNGDNVYSYEINNENQIVINTINGTFNSNTGVIWDYGDFNGDGNYDIFSINFQNDCFTIFTRKDDESKFVSQIHSGVGKETQFEMKPLTNNPAYNKVSNVTSNSQELVRIQPSLHVIYSLKEYDYFDNLLVSQSYFYESLLFHKSQRNFSGFLKTQVVDNINHSITTTEYSAENFFLTCFPIKIKTQVRNYYGPGPHDFIVEDVSEKAIEYYPLNSYNNPITDGGLNNYRQNTFPIKETVVDLINNRKTVSEYEKYLTVSGTERTEQSISTVYESADVNAASLLINTKEITYSNAPFCDWYEVLPIFETTEIIQEIDNDTYSRSAKFEYGSNGNLIKSTSDPNDPLSVQTEITSYDAFGHALITQVSAPLDPALPIITNKVEYDETGRFPVKKINALNQEENSIAYNAWGQPIYTIDINGHETRFEYDDLMRQTHTYFTDGTVESKAIEWVSSAPNILFKTISSSSGVPDYSEYYDAAGRVVMTESRNLNNQIVLTDIAYNTKGQEIARSLPYFSGVGIAQNSTMEYDYLGRLKKVILPDNSYKESIYNPNEVISRVSKNGVTQQKRETYDGAGRLDYVTDNNGVQTHYSYYASGKLNQAWVGTMTQKVSMQYNLQGQRTTLNDPDAGAITTEYNAYGQMISQTDARGIITTYDYDVLGRPLHKDENAGEFLTSWIYDTRAYGLGLLSGVYYSNGTSDEYFYDGLSRPVTQRETVESNIYIMQTTYDNLGRADRITYPDGYCVQYSYQNGYLNEISDYSNGENIWAANSQDQWGNIVTSTYGNTLDYSKSFDNLGRLEQLNASVQGANTSIQAWFYTYDDMGNIESRSDYISNQTEHFAYDNLNRLNNVWIDDPINQVSVNTLSMDYDNYGNMTWKSDIGVMNYDPSGRPHALDNVEPVSSYLPNDHELKYFPSGMTKKITDLVDNKYIDFVYGPDKQRRKTTYYENDVLQSTKYFAFGNYEETVDANSGDVTKFLYIGSPDGIVAMRKTVNGPSQMYYVLTDHLGSIDAVVPAVSGVMPLVEYYSYDAWGRRRDPNTWEILGTAELEALAPTLITDRGFTMHEHMDTFNLINMLSEAKSSNEVPAGNGRAYDPIVGQFLSPDPFVQNSEFSQSYNRYSYCWNNPLKYTDPSGYANDLTWIDIQMRNYAWGTSYTNTNYGWVNTYWYNSIDQDIAGYMESIQQGYWLGNTRIVASSEGIDLLQSKSGNRTNGWSGYGLSNDKFTPMYTTASPTETKENSTGGLDGFFLAESVSIGLDYGDINRMIDYWASNEVQSLLDGFIFSKKDNNTIGLVGLGSGTIAPFIYNDHYFLGKNWKYNSTAWKYGNQYTGTSLRAMNIAKPFKFLGYAGFAVNLVYGINDIRTNISQGNYDKASLSGFSLVCNGVATFGGPIGLVIAGPFVLIDATIGLDNFYQSVIDTEIERSDRISRGDYSMWAYPRFGQSYR